MKPRIQLPEATLIAVDPAGTVRSEEQTPLWDSARAIHEGMVSTHRMSCASMVILGGELLALKKELGFIGSGRRKEKDNDCPFLSGPRTWEKWVKSELEISEGTAERYIRGFKALKDSIEVLGECKLLECRPSKLENPDQNLLWEIVTKTVGQDSMNDLLKKFPIVADPKNPHTLTDADRKKAGAATAKKKAQADSDDAADLASVHLKNLYNDLTALEREVRLAREHSKLKSFLFVLNDALNSADEENPLPEGVVDLSDYRRHFEKLKTAIEEDLSDLLDEINKAIKPKMQGPAPKRVRKTSKPNKK